jgi:hypothetical protein
LTFWARAGDAEALFETKVGGVSLGAYPDSIVFPVSSGTQSVGPEWRQFRISLEGQVLRNVVGGFCVVFRQENNPNGCTLLLDEIRFEVVGAGERR